MTEVAEGKRARLATEMAQWRRGQWNDKKAPLNRDRPRVSVATVYPIVRWTTLN